MTNEIQNADALYSYAQMEQELAKRRIMESVRLLRSYLDDVERGLAKGRPPTGEAANMGQHVARIAECAGRMDLLEDLSGWTTPAKSKP